MKHADAWEALRDTVRRELRIATAALYDIEDEEKPSLRSRINTLKVVICYMDMMEEEYE